MKLSQVLISTLALGAVAGAQAQGIEHLTGASASRNNVVIALNSICTGGNMTLFKDASGVTNPGNIFTAKCNSGNFGTTAVNEVRMNVNGGSLNAVLASIAGTVQLTYIDASAPPATCAAAAPGTGAMAGVSIRASCGTAGLTAASSLGGYMDVEGPVFAASGLTLPAAGAISTNFKVASFNQAFGIAVSKRLYEALQEYQVAKGRLPSTCAPLNGSGAFQATGDTTPACQPSISKAEFTAYSASGTSLAKRGGANYLIGGTNALASDLGGTTIASPLAGSPGKRLYLCRRPATSGTQAASQVYFLNRPTASGSIAGFVLPAGLDTLASGLTAADTSTGSLFTARTASGSSDVVTCLNGNPASDANPAPTANSTTQPTADPLPYAMGVISLENNPLPSANYRFVKLSNQHAVEGAASTAQTTESAAGRYDFWFESVKFCPNNGGGTCASTLDAVDANLQTGAASPGIFKPAETNYSRGGKATRPISNKN